MHEAPCIVMSSYIKLHEALYRISEFMSKLHEAVCKITIWGPRAALAPIRDLTLKIFTKTLLLAALAQLGLPWGRPPNCPQEGYLAKQEFPPNFAIHHLHIGNLSWNALGSSKVLAHAYEILTVRGGPGLVEGGL